MNYYRLDEICEINPKKTISNTLTDEISFIPMDAVSTDGKIDTSRTISVKDIKNYTIFRNGDILFAKITPCMENGKGTIATGLKNGYGAGSTEFIVLRPDTEKITLKWLQLFLSQKSFRLYCQQNMTGSAGQKRVPPKFLATCVLPVPTLEMQEQGISQIEELFSQLDSGVETLKKTKQQLAVYRQAVLKEAFEGDIPQVRLGEIAQVLGGYAFKSNKYSEDGKYVVVKIGNVKEFRFDFSRDLTKTTEVDDSILNRYLLQKGDCLITLTGSRGKRDYGYVAMITDQTNFLLNQRVAALRFDPKVAVPKFYQYYLSSPDYRNQFFSYETGNVGQGNVGIKALSEPMVICPTIEKQQEIIGAIESRMSVCDSIEQTISIALQQAEAMRQSILKKAFEGGL